MHKGDIIESDWSYPTPHDLAMLYYLGYSGIIDGDRRTISVWKHTKIEDEDPPDWVFEVSRELGLRAWKRLYPAGPSGGEGVGIGQD